MKKILHFNSLRTKFYMFVLFMFTSLVTFGQVNSKRTITVGDDVACGKLIDVELELTGTGTYSTPLEVVLVIDVSGSMAWSNSDNTATKIEDAVDAAENFVDNFFSDPNIHPDSKIGIVKFQSYATVVQGLTNDETFDDGNFWGVGYGDNFRANGGTNMEDGVEEAFGLLNHESACNITKTIIMLGDGAATSDNGSGDPSTRAILEALNAQSIAQIYTIGFNVGVGSSAENTLTEMQNAGYYAGASATDLDNIYTDILNQLSWVAKAPPSGVFNTEVVEGDFKIDNTTISVTKGSFLVTGQKIEWSVDYLNKDEVITLHYQLISNGICDDVNKTEISSSGLTYLNANCETVEGSPLPTSFIVPCSGDEIIEICQGETSAEFISNIDCPDAGVTSDLINERYAGNGANNGSGDSWNNPGNIDADDGQTASLLLQSGDSKDLHATGFNFSSIPDNATINGITVEINRWASSSSGTNGVKDTEISLLKAGSVVGNNKKKSDVWNTSSGTVVTYGGSTDLWGTSWSVSEIKNINFGARLEVNIDGSRSAHVDYIKIKVYYSITTIAGNIEWFTTEFGGTSLGSGNVFSPINSDPNFDYNAPGTYNYYAGCSNIPGCRKLYRIKVKENPTCNITGNATTCPSGSETYTAPDGMESYSWSITSGTATINGASDEQTVEVIAGSCNEDFTLELTVTNSNECSSTCSLDVEVEDNIAPTFDATPGNLTASCIAPAPYEDYTAFVAAGGLVSDNCALNTASFTHVGDVSDNNTCEPTIQRTYRIFDACGLSVDYVQEISIEREDFTIPTTTDNSQVACAAEAVANTVTLPVVTSDCGETLSPSAPVTNKAGTDTFDGCEGTISYTWTYEDCAGNSNDWTYTYTIEREDFTIPTTTDNSQVACAAEAVANTVTLPVVTSDCGETLSPSAPVTNKAGTDTFDGCEGTISYTWTYEDCAGNSNDWTYTYTIEREDFTIPTTTDNSQVACAAEAVANTVTLPVVTSDCGETLSPSAPVTNKAGTDTFDGCEGTISYTWTYEDCAGNSNDWTYTYTIEREDFTIPTTTDNSQVACAAEAVANTVTLPVVTSDCGETLSPSAPVTNKAGTDTFDGCEGTISYTWTYEDCAGNSNDWTYTYTIEREDFTIPTTTDNSQVACAAEAVANTVTLPVVTSDCGETLSPSAPVTNKAGTDTFDGCEGTISYTWTYEDCAGNSNDWTYTYTIEREDFTIPTTTDNSQVACAAEAVANTVTLPVVTSDCGETLSPSAPVTNKAGTDTFDGCEGTISYTWTYEDCAGNSNDWTYTYTIEREDFTIPTTTDNSQVACAAEAVANTVTLPVVTSDCGETLSPSAPVTNKAGTDTFDGCEGTISYTWTYEDCAGNSNDWTYTYTIEREDFTIPTTTDNSQVACAAEAVANTVTLPVVTSDCGETLSPSAPVTNKAGTDTFDGCEGTISYTWTYEDCAGNSNDWTYTYTIEREDFTIPTTTDNSQVACAAEAVANTVTLPVVTSDCGETLSPSAPVTNKAGTDTFDGCEGTISYTWTYEDCAGNSNDWTYTYTIEREDFTIPTTTDNSQVACAAEAVANTVTLPVVTSDCGETLSPSAPVTNKAGTDTFDGCEGTISYTWTYEDCAGNSNDWTYTYTIEREDFTIPTTTDNSQVACAAEAVANTVTLPVVTSDCGETLSPSAPVTNKAGTDTFDGCEGTISYTWTYEDCAGNSNDWTYTYTIEREDFTIPTTTDNSQVACAAEAVANTVTLPVVTSDCGETLSPSAPVTNKAGTDTFDGCEGTISYTWTYEDCAGNSNDWTYTYTIEKADFTMPENESETVNDLSEIYEPNNPTVYDYCGKLITDVTGPVISESPDCEGAVTYTWTYTDCSGKFSHDWIYTFTIDRIDFTVPEDDAEIISCLAELYTPQNPSVNDAYGNPITNVTGPIVSENPACEGDVSYVWTYTDCSEKFSHDWTYTFTIEREDFIIPENTSETVACVADFEGVTPPVVTDACGNLITPVAAEAPVAPACEGDMVYTWTYTDCEGNSHDWSHTVTIEREDFIMPENTSETVACVADFEGVTPPVVTDACGNLLTPVADEAPVAPACEGDMVYTWTYTDCEGNSHDWSHTVTIEREDFIMPQNTSETVACVADFEGVTPPEVYDACGNMITPVAAEAPVAPACEGDMVYTWTYTDCEGNSHDWSHTVTIEREDFIMPENTSETVACVADFEGVTPPEVTDACGNMITPVAAEAPVAPACEGDMVYTWTYTDCEGNSHDWSHTVTIEREDFIMPQNTSETVACVADFEGVTPPEVYDACGNMITPVAAEAPVAPACEGDMVYTWTYTDCEGNSHDWSHTVTIEREDFIMPENTSETVACVADFEGVTPPVVYDACGNMITPVAAEAPVAPACEGDMVYSWTYTDCEGNSHDWSHTVTIEREDFIMPENTSETVACVADFEGVTPPEVYDACGNMITPVAAEAPVAPACEGDMVYTWTYTDCEGNSHDWSHTVTIEREDFIMPENTSETVACVADFEGVTPPEVTDACGNLLTPVAAEAPVAPACEGDMVYSWTYTDCEGNSHDWSHTVTIEREDFIMPENTSETVACVADFEGVTPPEVTDACGNLLTPVAAEAPVAPACEGNMVYTWTYTDCEGNAHDWSHTVTIEREDFIMPENTSETVACAADFKGVTPPEVTDACGNLLTPVAAEAPVAPACEGNMVYTWTYTDCEGNSHDWSHTVTIEREDFIMPENTSETVACVADFEGVTPPEVTDACGNLLTPVAAEAPVAPACEGNMVYTWTYTDCEGNSHDWSHTVTIEREDFIMPENTSETVACVADFEGVTPPEVTDACGNLLTPVAAEAPVAPACEGDMVYTWTYTDCEGNAHDWSHTVTIEREDFIMPENTSETVACVADFEGVTPPEVTDACGNLLTPVAAEAPVAPACEGDMVYTWTYTDCEGNAHDWSHTVTIEREDFIMPENTSETVACAADFKGVTPPEVTDACGNLLTPVAAEAPVAPACEGNMVYTWTYTDCEGNSHDWSHTVTIEREDFIMPENTSETVACVADFEGVTPPEVTDACGNLLTPVAAEAPVAPACEGNMVYTWTYTDCEGNSHDWSHTVTIEREDFIMPENTSETVACVADFEGVTPPEVYDACGNLLTPIAGDEPAVVECEGDMVYTWTYTDCEGNAHDWSHTVTIEREDFIMPENTSETVACVADFEGVTPPEVTDACGNLLTPVAAEAPVAPACEGDMVYTWTYTDCEGNAHDWSHTVTIEREDFIMPENTSETLACIADFEGVTPPEVTDACGNLITPVAAEAPVAPACEGNMVYTWTYTDCEGNSHNWSHTVNIKDEIAPNFNETLPTAEVTAECDDVAEAVVLTATDNCDSEVPVEFTETRTDGNCANSYTLTRVWTATDDCGNETSFTQTVTVSDNTAPTFNETLPLAEITAECDDVAEAVVLTAADNCDSDVPVEFTETRTDGNCENSYTLTRTWTATDDCGNETSFTQTVTVSDNTAPTFNETLPTAEITAECDDVAEAVVLTATDNCDSDVPVVFVKTRTDGNCANSYTLTRVWTATDDCGNETSFTQTVTVSDNTAPAFNETLPLAEITAECDDVAEAVILTAADNCDSDVPVEFTETRTDGNCENSYTLTRTWTATDDCGNETSFTQTVTVSDNTAPAFNETLPTAEITAECDDVAEAVVLTAADNCDSDVPVEFTETRTDGNCENSYTLARTWTATDDCGNETSFTQTVIVSDNTAPEVSCNDITVQLDANGVATITVDDINGGATDNCGTIATMFISQETFNCDNVGENQVTLTAIDECGNEATCTATVTVEEGDADCGFDPFKANDDILTLIYCPGETVSGELDLFANDEGFTRENVSFTILTDLPNGVSATDGNLLYVNEQPTEAVITFTYSVCHTVNTENCDTAEVTIVVLLDTDCDGVPNNDDIDDDDDGILDIIEEENALDQTSLDSDGDGIVDRLDIDSDNDGIVDNIEWQSTIAEDGEYDYILPLGIDSNGDGWDDAYDPTSNGITYEPWDMDLDGTPDYLDTDTDSEGEDDNVEGWDEFPNDSIADVSFIGSDADGDGLDDAYDTYNTTTEGWTRGQNAIGSNAYLQDTDADGVRDWRDAVDDRTPPEQFACGQPVIPNAFSPNQDGYNDYFKIMIYCTGDQGGSEERVLGDDFNDARIEIFNRWGNLVYEQERYGNESYWGDVDAWWDGSSMHDMQLGNNQLPTATYYYILYFNDGSREPITGFVFLNN